MSEQNTGWRDIETDQPKETREDILCYEPPIAGPYPSPARRYVSSGYALKHQYLCGTEDQNPTHWQPFPHHPVRRRNVTTSKPGAPSWKRLLEAKGLNDG